MAIRCTPCEDMKRKNQKPSPTPSKKENKYTTEWTGKCPCKYFGEWKLYKNNQDVTNLFPTTLRYCPAYTYGEYPVWEEKPYSFVQQYVTDGYQPAEWIQYNMYWLQLVGDTSEDFLAVYFAFHENDFRTSRFM